MTIRATIILITILSKSYGQVTLGTGIVKIEFNDKTVVDFYHNPTDKVNSKRLEFFDDKNSWNIKNLDKESTWLKPELLWLDYSQFNFRCKSATTDWLEVIVNNEDGQSLWIKRTKATKFITWEEYFKNMFAIDRRQDKGQKIKKRPTHTADEIKYEGRDCFQVKSLKGDWIEIFTTDLFDKGERKVEIKSGWIKWKRKNELLINYYTTS